MRFNTTFSLLMQLLKNPRQNNIVLFCLLASFFAVLFLNGDLKLKESSFTRELSGEILKVYDGDTITLFAKENQEKVKIRLYGLDAPELNQSYGKEARDYLLSLCPLNSEVKIYTKEKDKYNRYIGILYCKGINVNEKLVEQGFAWAYREYSKDYVSLESEAKKNRVGLWSETNPLKPSEFRRQ